MYFLLNFRTDEFTIECLKLDGLDSVRIYHDNTGYAPAWYLDKVSVVDIETHRKYEFPCNQWLARTKGDGHISRDLEYKDPNKQDDKGLFGSHLTI